MDFALTKKQSELKQSLIEFAESELGGDMRGREHAGEFFWQGWKKSAAFGIQGLPVPERYGGRGEDAVMCMVAMQALGYGCRDSGLLFTLNSHMWTCEMPIVQFGSEEQKQAYLPGMVAGTIVGGHAVTEAEAGSDAFALRTTAVRKGDRYILDGTKTFVSNAPIAGVFLVFAATNPKLGWAGISAFLVARDTPGLHISGPVDKMGLKTSPTGTLSLDRCEVPETAMLGRPGQGSAIFNAEMEWERSCLFASHLGAMQRQLQTCIHHSKHRTQFGKPIAEFQGISHKLADMKVRIELAELILAKVAWLKSQGKRAHMEAAIAKLFVSESYVASSLDAIQIHGGKGYLPEFEVERDLRDAVGSRLYSGTSEIQRNIIARLLGV
ncbi:MAG: acyl-CoA dehydrogenase family protein [Proteobacteria bacterium]|nr:acyl-CoA dehydrogenase family protein [Pseudomonadota bacterium]